VIRTQKAKWILVMPLDGTYSNKILRKRVSQGDVPKNAILNNKNSIYFGLLNCYQLYSYGNNGVIDRNILTFYNSVFFFVHRRLVNLLFLIFC
jgi:hypothetical protein